MWNTRGLIVVAIFAAILALPLSIYWKYLTSANRPPSSTLILNQMEKSGVPDFKLLDLKGQEHSLSQYKDKVVLLNFWASWCAPCVKEFPSLQRLAEHFKGQVVVLAVSHDKNKEDLDSFLATFGKPSEHFQIWWDQDRKVGETYGVEVIPETFIIAPGFKLVRKIAGEDEWDSPMAIKFFEELINQ